MERETELTLDLDPAVLAGAFGHAPAGMGTRIRQARERRGLSLSQLATRVHVTKGILWQLETGRADTSCARIIRIARELGASLDWLLLG